jgi:hypothetical protein
VGSGAEALMSQAFTQGFIIKDGQRVIDSSVGALTVQGDINIGANRVRTTNLVFKEVNAFGFVITDDTEASRLNLTVDTIYPYSNVYFPASGDSISEADTVKLGGFDLAAGRRTLALGTEEAVAVEAALASTHTLSVRINGATYRILLTNA